MSPMRRLANGARAVGLVVLVSLTPGCGGGDGGGAKLSNSAQSLVEARQAIGDGNLDAALKALDASIASEPNLWAYLERAKVHATKGSDQAALDDCEAVLKLQPENRDVPWIKDELKKPVANRFQGSAAIPPSYKK